MDNGLFCITIPELSNLIGGHGENPHLTHAFLMSVSIQKQIISVVSPNHDVVLRNYTVVW